jgi:ABC-type siderophore export system fused ATPase/permease subunit
LHYGFGDIILYGAQVQIFTDYKSLKYLLTQKELTHTPDKVGRTNQRLRLHNRLSLGKENVVADALSQKSKERINGLIV